MPDIEFQAKNVALGGQILAGGQESFHEAFIQRQLSKWQQDRESEKVALGCMVMF
jgi:hypothetical protein